jgi:hypothetical protein
MTFMAYRLSRRSVIALVPTLALTCSADPSSTIGQEADTEDFVQFRSHSSLPGSEFEVDDDANLKQDDPARKDWATENEIRVADLDSGKDDNSYSGGAKEDDICPAIGTGSIPNNKSDLKVFGALLETGTPGFLHLFWTRVQDPSGTTLLDFEFNQSEEPCDPDDMNNPQKMRTIGDFLLEYRIAQGGASATIKKREWNGAAWGPAEDLTGQLATGTINSSAIPQAAADGLGALDPRTFGEASLDLDAIFDDEESCRSFGSAFVKSRSSDTFSSALKDFLPELDINISNCGQVIIRKEIDGDHVEEFEFTHSVETSPASGNAFKLGGGDDVTISNVLLNDELMTQYFVTEAESEGFNLVNIDCSASFGVVPNVDLGTRTVTFAIDAQSDVVDCTFTNASIPLTNITMSVDSQVDGGTSSTITCEEVGPVPTASNGDGSLALTDLLAGEYTCTVLISD